MMKSSLSILRRFARNGDIVPVTVAAVYDRRINFCADAASREQVRRSQSAATAPQLSRTAQRLCCEMSKTLRVLSLILLAGLSDRAFGDEGMWLFNNPPLKQFKEKYQFEPTPQWLEHLQKSRVRFNPGGSGSFVSAKGLCITNHHVGLDTLQKMSGEKNNYVRDGFYAKSQKDEVKATDLELNVLMSIEDVTDRAKAAVRPDMSPDDANKARSNAIAEIEKESREKTGLRSDVVTLYQGGQYHLYRYKRFDGVRLVFAPEEQIAFYGGDPDNFEYPRFDLDVCIFRVYENGQPARIEHYLKWNTKGPADGELTFVSGNPGRTDRMLAVSELAELRNDELPYLMSMYFRRETFLHSWGARSFENKRRAENDTRSVENNRKRYDGYLTGLLDPDVWRAIEDRQKKLTEASDVNALFDKIKQAQAATAKVLPVYEYFEQFRGEPQAAYRAPRAFYSTLFQYARRLLRHGDEMSKPNGDRFPEVRDSYKESLELELLSSQPVYDDLEIVKLTDSLTDMVTRFGSDDSLVRHVLAGKSPADRARELVTGSKLKDIAVRKQLYSGGAAAVSTAIDPMIELARFVDGPARAARKVYEAQDEIKQQAYAEIAKARFAAQGTSTYPDATFTLRLSYGTVRGYEEGGKQIPADR